MKQSQADEVIKRKTDESIKIRIVHMNVFFTVIICVNIVEIIPKEYIFLLGNFFQW
jgi:hypothetical protein